LYFSLSADPISLFGAPRSFPPFAISSALYHMSTGLPTFFAPFSHPCNDFLPSLTFGPPPLCRHSPPFFPRGIHSLPFFLGRYTVFPPPPFFFFVFHPGMKKCNFPPLLFYRSALSPSPPSRPPFSVQIPWFHVLFTALFPSPLRFSCRLLSPISVFFLWPLFPLGSNLPLLGCVPFCPVKFNLQPHFGNYFPRSCVIRDILWISSSFLLSSPRRWSVPWKPFVASHSFFSLLEAGSSRSVVPLLFFRSLVFFVICDGRLSGKTLPPSFRMVFFILIVYFFRPLDDLPLPQTENFFVFFLGFVVALRFFLCPLPPFSKTQQSFSS